MKKKKEFFRIRKDRKRKNGARDRLPLFSQQGKSPTEKPVFCFLNNAFTL